MLSFFKDPYGYVSSKPKSNYKYLLLFFNWFFQGYFNKDRTEFLFKLLLEVSMITYSYCFLLWITGDKAKILYIFLFAHTINWLVTGCIWCVLRPKYGLQMIKNKNKINVDSYIKRILSKIQSNASIKMCVIFGSLSQDQFHIDSDIDIAIIRHKGFMNSYFAYKLILQERLYALLTMVPLDILLFDSIDSFKEMADEEGVIIYLCESEKSKCYNCMEN